MPDKGHNYSVKRLALELQIDEHRSTIEKNRARVGEIERTKALNTRRAALANAELDDEAARIADNEDALNAQIAKIEGDLAAMVKT